jgi:hypothetical protein
VPDLDRFPHPADTLTVPVYAVDRNVGHGRVFPRPDKVVKKCGGPALCRECQTDEGKRATAEALWSGVEEEPNPARELGDRPEFNREVVRAFKARDRSFPSTDGRLWSRVVLDKDGLVLCAWDADGGFHQWGSIEQLAAALLRVAEKAAR